MEANHPDGEADLVTELAGPLPLQVICDMMGIPEEDHQRVFHWTNVILGFGDPDLTLDFEEFMQVSMDIGAYATALAEDRRSNHHDDLTTALVEAEVDGDRLTSQEIASFFILLVVAGNETTRNAISHGVLALSRFPEQRDKWWSRFDELTPTAVEEIVRWASPVIYMRRTLTQDFELSGVKMAAGDKVALYYNSANRDETRFDNPWAFDVARNPNPHLGFGGGGAHFCLGANLARREIRVVFDELRREIPDITVTGKPSRLLSQFIHGIKTLPVSRLRRAIRVALARLCPYRNEFSALRPSSGIAPNANVSALPTPTPPPTGSSTRTSRSRSWCTLRAVSGWSQFGVWYPSTFKSPTHCP
nr:hypothetical protein MFLOJ_59110 [Mycobacterium florentinum]